MKVHKRAPADIWVAPGDHLQLTYTETAVDESGRIVERRERVVVKHDITETHHFDEAVVIESEPGEFGADYGLGGLFLEHKTP